jgi:hypothetical protein
MRDSDYTVLFAIRENPVNPADNEFSSKQIDIEIKDVESSLVVGEYEYESNPSFGTPTTSNGHIVFDKKSPLVAVSKTHDIPKAYSLLNAVDSALNTEISTPDISPRSQHMIYEKYGFGEYPNGYVVSFKENSSDYFDAGNSMGVTLDPEDEASERAKFSNERISDDMVHDIAQNAIDDGMHIWSCDLVLGEEGHTIGFSDPLRFTKVDRDWIQENNGFEDLFSVCRDAL